MAPSISMMGEPTTALCHLRQEGFFVAESSPNAAGAASQTRGRQVLDSEQVRRALIRIAHEILEGNVREPDIVIVGIHSGGRSPRRADSRPHCRV